MKEELKKERVLTAKTLVFGIIFLLISMLLWMIFVINYPNTMMYSTTGGPCDSHYEMIQTGGAGFDWTYPMIFILIIMILAPIVGKKYRLSPGQLGLLYVFGAIGSSSYVIAQIMGPVLAIPRGWADAITKGWIPSYWSAKVGPDAWNVLYFGEAGAGVKMPWGQIALPVIYWSVVVIFWMLIGLFLSALFEKQWIDVESLPFPSANSVVDIITPATASAEVPIYKTRVFQYGFILAFALMLTQMPHIFNPAIPRLPIGSLGVYVHIPNHEIDITPTIKGAFSIAWDPFYILGAYILPADCLFTFWVVALIQETLWPAIGIRMGLYPDFASSTWTVGRGGIGMQPYAPFYWYWSAIGLMFGTAIWAIWNGRKHLAKVLKAWTSKETSMEEGPIPYKYALIGLVLSYIIFNALLNMAGVGISATVWMALISFAMPLFMIRRRAEFWKPDGGMLWQWYHNETFPNYLLGKDSIPPYTQDWGAGLGARSMIASHFAGGTQQSLDCKPAQITFIDAYYIARKSNSRLRDFFIASLIGFIIMVGLGSWIYLWLGSIGLGPGAWWHDMNAPYVDDPKYFTATGRSGRVVYDMWASGAPYSVFGIVLSLAFFWARSKFAWFPFNPLGWLMIGCTGPASAIIPILIAWVLKQAVLRVGGARLNQTMLRFIYGFLLGWMFEQFIIQAPITFFLLNKGANVPPT